MAAPPGHWLNFPFTGRKAKRRGIGTRVTLHVVDHSILQELAGDVRGPAAAKSLAIQSANSAMDPSAGPADRPWPGRSGTSTLRPWYAK